MQQAIAVNSQSTLTALTGFRAKWNVGTKSYKVALTGKHDFANVNVKFDLDHKAIAFVDDNGREHVRKDYLADEIFINSTPCRSARVLDLVNEFVYNLRVETGVGEQRLNDEGLVWAINLIERAFRAPIYRMEEGLSRHLMRDSGFLFGAHAAG